MTSRDQSQSDRLFEDVLRGGGGPDSRMAALLGIIQSVQIGLTEAHNVLSEAVPMHEYEKRERACGQLSDASVLCANLIDLLQDRSDSGLKLDLTFSGPQRPVNWANRRTRAEVDNRAARLVERLVRAGWQQERAVRHVALRKKHKAGRDRIFRALGIRRGIRAHFPNASEEVLLSWLVEGLTPT